MNAQNVFEEKGSIIELQDILRKKNTDASLVAHYKICHAEQSGTFRIVRDL